MPWTNLRVPLTDEQIDHTRPADVFSIFLSVFFYTNNIYIYIFLCSTRTYTAATNLSGMP